MKSITVKLSLITAVVFTVFVGAMLLFQSAFFGDYYVSQKKRGLQRAAEYLTSVYAGATGSLNEKVNGDIAQYAAKNGLFVFYIEKDQKNAAGVFSTWGNSYMAQQQQQLLIELVDRGKTVYAQNKPLADSGKPLEYDMQDAYGNQFICTVGSIARGGRPKGLLYVVTSMQPVGEAAAVIKDYYLIFFAVALTLIVGLSILYSRRIAKPLIHINRVAGQIAKQDFSQECTYRSKDELGSLASTVNTLSANLSGTIRLLEDSNKKLSAELAKEKELEQTRKQFVADVSHELKTPLSVIRGYVEKLSDEGPDDIPAREEAVSIIIAETNRMDRLIRSMLDLSSMEAGAVAPDTQPISLNRMIRYTLNNASDEIAKKSIRVKYEPDGDTLALGDAFRIGQVLTNLIGNAVQYTPPGGFIDIRVSENAGEVLFEIENGEARIPEDELNNIWNQFYRVEKSHSKAHGGVGLGLSIVRRILELHGSRYGARNTENGVLFFFTLPACPHQTSATEI